jgi:acyl-CoA reductase-like NAD-dependent aldehyde dehydrogenase
LRPNLTPAAWARLRPSPVRSRIKPRSNSAIAGGNAVILKRSELAPLSALRLVEVLVQAGLPEEIITVAVGGAELGKAIIDLHDVRMVTVVTAVTI